MKNSDREGRDVAGVGPYAHEREELVPMSSLASWTVSDGEPDIRGWEIHTVSGRQLGTVSDLLIDAKAGEVVLLDVGLPGTDRHTFVPIRVVHIDRARRRVLMDSADLPESALTRGPASATPDRRITEPRTVRYGQGDREVRVDRLGVPDDDVSRDRPPRSGGDISASAGHVGDEQRRGTERRRIDRMNTEF